MLPKVSFDLFTIQMVLLDYKGNITLWDLIQFTYDVVDFERQGTVGSLAQWNIHVYGIKSLEMTHQILFNIYCLTLA